MRKLITAINSGDVFGTFNTVVTLSDLYKCDNSLEIQFDVIGPSTVSDMPEDYVIPTGPPEVPKSVTRRQALLALYMHPAPETNLLDAVEAFIAAISDPVQKKIAEIYWNESVSFNRDEPMLISIGTQIGLTSLDIDNLFITAASL